MQAPMSSFEGPTKIQLGVSGLHLPQSVGEFWDGGMDVRALEGVVALQQIGSKTRKFDSIGDLVSDHETSGKIHIVFFGCLQDHARLRLPAIARAAVLGKDCFFMERTHEGIGQMDPFLFQEIYHSRMDGLVLRWGYFALGDPGLVGADN